MAVKGRTRRYLIRNYHIRMKLGNDKISRHKTEWRLHVERIDSTRFSRKSLDCRPKGKINVRRPRKRWLD